MKYKFHRFNGEPHGEDEKFQTLLYLHLF